jgi:hypothetical protein
VRIVRRWVKQRHAALEREDYLKEIQASQGRAQESRRGRKRKRRERSKERERREERGGLEWREPGLEGRMEERCAPQPEAYVPQQPQGYGPQPPVEEIPMQPAAMPEPVRVDYRVEVDELPEVVASLQSARMKESDCRSCSTESRSSSSSSESKAARRSRTSPSPDDGDSRAHVRERRQFSRGRHPRMPPRVLQRSRYRQPEFDYGGMPLGSQDARRDRGWGGGRQRYKNINSRE